MIWYNHYIKHNVIKVIERHDLGHMNNESVWKNIENSRCSKIKYKFLWYFIELLKCVNIIFRNMKLNGPLKKSSKMKYFGHKLLLKKKERFFNYIKYIIRINLKNNPVKQKIYILCRIIKEFWFENKSKLKNHYQNLSLLSITRRTVHFLKVAKSVF